MMAFNYEQMNSHDNLPTPKPENIDAANDNIEKTPQQHLAEKLESIITSNEFQTKLAQLLQTNPNLAQKLGLPENADSLQIHQTIDQATKDLADNTSHLIDILELVSIIQINPNNLAKVPQKFAKVISKNKAFFDRISNQLKEVYQSSDSNPVKRLAAAMLRISLETRPDRAATKIIDYLSGMLALTSEDEQAQAEIMANQLTENTLLKSWILLQALNQNKEFRQDAYQLASDEFEKHQAKKAA